MGILENLANTSKTSQDLTRRREKLCCLQFQPNSCILFFLKKRSIDRYVDLGSILERSLALRQLQPVCHAVAESPLSLESCGAESSATMYYLLGLPENVFFYFIVFHFILLSLNLGFIFVIFIYLAFNFIRRGGLKGDGRNLSD